MDQTNQICKKQWLSELVLEEIRRLIEDGESTGEVEGSEEDQERDRSEQVEVSTECTKSKTEDS